MFLLEAPATAFPEAIMVEDAAEAIPRGQQPQLVRS